ncbi:MAG: dTDP-4-dehydrorhamnose reductase [Sporichthyaceae bacterium]|nr:dTDP-4-dehydrorhamnose reductase [Sporichthyaceae bacterium]
MTRWLVVGAAGMLGRELTVQLTETGADVVALGRAELDITDTGAVGTAIHTHRPTVVVNCAGWTAVDEAETHEADALRVNGNGPANLVGACAEIGAKVVQISTDYVFDGRASTPYPEDAPPDPATAYGRTKLAGELAVLAGPPELGYVVRTAWLYGRHGPNFVRTSIGLADTKPIIDVVDDQVGQPTWARDLAGQLVALVGSGAPPGIYHATSAGQTSWYGLAREVFALLDADPDRVRPTTSAAFPRPAPRPAYSVLGHDRWAAVGLPPIRDWRAALAAAFPTLLPAPT